MTEGTREAILVLLSMRAPLATICPSEVARALVAGEGWRDAMPHVHAAVDRLFEEGTIRLSWKGRQLTERAGPYRITRVVR